MVNSRRVTGARHSARGPRSLKACAAAASHSSVVNVLSSGAESSSRDHPRIVAVFRGTLLGYHSTAVLSRGNFSLRRGSVAPCLARLGQRSLPAPSGQPRRQPETIRRLVARLMVFGKRVGRSAESNQVIREALRFLAAASCISHSDEWPRGFVTSSEIGSQRCRRIVVEASASTTRSRRQK